MKNRFVYKTYVLLFQKLINRFHKTVANVIVKDKVQVNVSNFPASFNVNTGLKIPKQFGINNLPNVYPVKVENFSAMPDNQEQLNKNMKVLKKLVKLQKGGNLVLRQIFAKKVPRTQRLPVNADPDKYMNVRVTNGKQFVEAFATAIGGAVIQYTQGQEVPIGTGNLVLGVDNNNLVVPLSVDNDGKLKVVLEEGAYSERVDEVSTDLTYAAKATVGSDTAEAVWQIKKIEKVGTVTSVLFADGNTNFDNVWDNRVSLTYS